MMGCRNRVVSDDGSSVSGSLSEALLFTTLCIIGLPVEVQVKDGSVYCGIFHTACTEKDYGIVLKKARMTKKGKTDANVASGGMIETLVVLSGDLVQVVAKGVLLPSDAFVGNVVGDDVEAVTGTVPSLECLESVAKRTKSRKFSVDKKQIKQTRRLAQNENGFVHGFTSTEREGKKMSPSYVGNTLEIENGKRDDMHEEKSEEASVIPVNGRQIGDDKLQRNQDDHKEKNESCDKESTPEVQSSRPSLNGGLIEVKPPEEVHAEMTSKPLSNGVSHVICAPMVCERLTSAAIPSSFTISSGVSTSLSSAVDVTSESGRSSSTTSTEMVPPRSSASSRSAKEFKLNPGAKIFSPSFTNPQSASPPVPTVASMAYMPNNSHTVPVAAVQQEIGINSFAPRPLPVKYIPHSNLTAGNGVSVSQNSQPIVGNLGSRSQPVRYAGHYLPVQAGSTYVQPNSQAVMVGRLGQLFYVHPVSHDVVQGAAAISPVPGQPLLTPQQVQFTKHQGSAAAQAMQLCAAPTFVGNGQQPFGLPSQLPFIQPPFRPLTPPGSTGFFTPKFQ